MARALIVTDMLNRYEHEDAEPLPESVRNLVPRLRALIAEAREREMLVAYVNDNRADWTAGREELAETAIGGAAPAYSSRCCRRPTVP